LGLLLITLFSSAQPFQKLKIIPEKIGEGLFDFYIENPNFCPVQINLQFTEFVNMQASCELPYISVVMPGKHKVFNLMRTYLDMAGVFKYDFQQQPGAFPVVPDEKLRYKLPVSSSKPTKAIAFDYSKTNTPDKIAWSFEMAAGDTVKACMNGVVCAITETQLRDTLRVGNNSITLFQPDGTFSKYEQLADKSIVVHLGDSIKTGDQLAIVESERTRTPQCRFTVYYVNTRVDTIVTERLRNFYTYVNPFFEVKGDDAIQLQGNKIYEN